MQKTTSAARLALSSSPCSSRGVCNTGKMPRQWLVMLALAADKGRFWLTGPQQVRKLVLDHPAKLINGFGWNSQVRFACPIRRYQKRRGRGHRFAHNTVQV